MAPGKPAAAATTVASATGIIRAVFLWTRSLNAPQCNKGPNATASTLAGRAASARAACLRRRRKRWEVTGSDPESSVPCIKATLTITNTTVSRQTVLSTPQTQTLSILLMERIFSRQFLYPISCICATKPYVDFEPKVASERSSRLSQISADVQRMSACQ